MLATALPIAAKKVDDAGDGHYIPVVMDMNVCTATKGRPREFDVDEALDGLLEKMAAYQPHQTIFRMTRDEL